jgi:hypothetical protein
MWLIYPLYRVSEYTYVSRESGEPTFNIYNNREFHESKLVQYINEFEFETNIPVYSNYAAAVYFFLNQRTLRAPHSDLLHPSGLDYLRANYADWPPSGEAYLVWFRPNVWHHYYTPDELDEIVDLEPIFKSKDGNLYRVSQR